MTDRRTISGRKRRMKDKGREGRLSKHVEAASFHVKRAAHSTKSCTCATPDSAASFGSRMNYRPVRGWALSFPVHAVAPSFPPCPHPLTTAARPSPSARIGRACRQQRFPPPSLRPLLHHHHYALLSPSPFFFHFQRKDTTLPPFFLFHRLGRFSLNSFSLGFYLLTLPWRSDNFQRVEDLIELRARQRTNRVIFQVAAARR